MSERLFTYYKSHASFHALIYSKMAKFYKFYRFSIIFVLCLVVLGLFTGVILFDNLFFAMFIACTTLLIFVIYNLTKIFDKRAMEVLKIHYSISSSPNTWRTYASDVSIHFVTEYLLENDLYSRWKIERLISDFEKENEKNKISPLVAPSIILAISVPNLTQLILHVYTFFNENQNIPQYIQNQSGVEIIVNGVIFSAVFFISILVVWGMSIFNRLKEEIREVFFNKEGPKRSGLIYTLESVLYQIHEK